MSYYESLPVKVTLTIEVDGHVFTFDETGKATGARYGGETPPHGYGDSVLEANVRGTVDTCTARAAKRAELLFTRVYPTASIDGSAA